MRVSPSGRDSNEPPRTALAGLVLAWAPGLESDDRAALRDGLTIGRGADAEWILDDRELSRTHFVVRRRSEGWMIEDPASRNGTYVDGERIQGRQPIEPGAVIRAGRIVFVAVSDLEELAPRQAARDGLGRFHTSALRDRIVAVARSAHTILVGEAGTGKARLAKAVHDALLEPGQRRPFVALDIARCDEGDVRDALVAAAGGTLFVAEIDKLSTRAQRSVVRHFEEAIADVRLLAASRVDPDALLPELAARLHRIDVPPLRERRADIPSIFEALAAERLPAIAPALRSKHVERLCVHDHDELNASSLVQVVTTIQAHVAEGTDEDAAIAMALDEICPLDEDVTQHRSWVYVQHRERILSAYEKHADVTEVERVLRAAGVPVQRRWLALYLELWRAQRR